MYLLLNDMVGSSELEDRIDGASIRAVIHEAFRSSSRIVIDFVGIKTITPSFADECFGKLLFDHEMKEIRSRAEFKNASPFVAAIIEKAFFKRIATREYA